MRLLAVLWVLVVLGIPRPANAQGPPPPIPRWVIDFHAMVPQFPSVQALADSRNLQLTELPGVGIGGDVAVHLYPFKWRVVTFGIGGRLIGGRAHNDAVTSAGVTTRAVTEQFSSLAPEISFNFGTGTGWSYLSGGLSTSVWSVVADEVGALPPDLERLQTVNYGGGARWFAKPHVAFSFDVRVYVIKPSSAVGLLPPSPRTTLIVVGAGVSLK